MQAVDFETMLHAPLGRYTLRSPFLAWVCTPQLCGITYLGRVGDEHLAALQASAALPFHRDLDAPYRAVIDISRLTEIGSGVFRFLLQHIGDMRGGDRLAKLAVLRPPGLVGAASSGLFHDFFLGHVDTCFCDDITQALAYLAASPDEISEITTMLDEALVRPSLVDRLRRILAAKPRMTLADAARELGMTTRGLQRTLHDARTTFREESARGRFANALDVLATTADKIEVVARQAGYASALNFARRVRREYGVTPSTLRDSLRARRET